MWVRIPLLLQILNNNKMDKTVEQLERELTLAKKKSNKNALEKKLDELREKYENTCYASHKYYRNNFTNGKNFNMVKFSNLRIEQNSILVDVSDIYKYNTTKGSTNLSISLNNTCNLSERDYSIGSGMKKVEDRFDEVVQLINATNDIWETNIKLTSPSELQQTIGEYGDERNELELFNNCGVEYIDTRSLNEIGKLSFEELLTWYNFPFMVGGKIIKSDYSKKAIELIIDKKLDNAVSWGGVIYERDLPRINRLKELLKYF